MNEDNNYPGQDTLNDFFEPVLKEEKPDCSSCIYSKFPHEGHCYMFKDSPTSFCGQFRKEY